MDAAKPPTILLFDIDGTLVTTPGVGRRSLERAFHARYGRAPDFAAVPQGVTDRGMIRDALAAIGERASGDEGEAAIDGVLAAYLPILEEEIERTPAFALHAGVVPLLDAIAGRPHLAIGLGTGNVRE